MMVVAHVSGCVSMACQKVMQKAETQMLRRNELYLAKLTHHKYSHSRKGQEAGVFILIKVHSLLNQAIRENNKTKHL